MNFNPLDLTAQPLNFGKGPSILEKWWYPKKRQICFLQKREKKLCQIWPQQTLKHFTAAYRGSPPCIQSQHPINRETGYSNVLGGGRLMRDTTGPFLGGWKVRGHFVAGSHVWEWPRVSDRQSNVARHTIHHDWPTAGTLAAGSSDPITLIEPKWGGRGGAEHGLSGGHAHSSPGAAKVFMESEIVFICLN